MLQKFLKILKMLLEFLGFYPQVFWTNISGLGWYFRDKSILKKQLRKNAEFSFGVPYPVLDEKKALSGRLSGHYFHQDLWVAQRVFQHQPTRHVDIGSRTDGFVTHVASFREIEVFDIRETDVQVLNIKFIKADLMQAAEEWENYTDSISCLHVIEHFGLGRYGDPIDVDGHLKGLENIYKMLTKGGKFYFSTPIGPERINFNAHRVFGLTTLVAFFEGLYQINDFSYVDDEGTLHRSVNIKDGIADNFGCVFGCAIFELTKL